tara:strand:- start:1060 stop:2352 length:1293 start_codon:yes stop_codon:yes gene_type:complete
MVELSIIIPIYNSEKYIKSCLNSICKQIKNQVELVLVNDSSTDSSLKICRVFSKKYKNIKIINNKKNLGVSISRNIGIKNSTGKYIFFCDSDDLLIRNSINLILNNIKKFSINEIFILRSKATSLNVIDKNQIMNTSLNKKGILNRIKNFEKFRTLCWNYIIQKKFLLANNLQFKNIRVFEDQVFVSNLLCKVESFKIISKPVYLNRAFEPITLSKKTGYIIVNSCVKILYEIANIFINQKNFFNRKKTIFLKSRLRYASDQLFIHLLTCNSLEIKRISKYLLKNFKIFSKVLKFNTKYFIRIIKERKNIEKNLLKHKEKKIFFIKNIILKTEKNKLIIFCAGSFSHVILKTLRNLGVKIHHVIDNNPHYLNKQIDNIKIKNSLYLKKNLTKFMNYSFLVCNQNSLVFSKIKIQLIKLGFSKNKIIQLRI